MPSSSNTNANSVLPALHHALSGSLGTLISTCTLYPLSLVITRLQVQRQLRREGRLAPAPAPAPPARAPTSPLQEHPPQDQADTQAQQDRDQQLQRPSEYAGVADAFSQIWSSDGNGGLKAFYTGLAQDAPKSVLDSFLFFLFYEWFRALRLKSRRRAGGVKSRGLGIIEEIAVGMAAGACSRSFTTPIANIVTRKQTATLLNPDDTASVRDIVRSIRKEKGIAGFWSGYSASLVLTLNPSLTFFLQEFLKTTFAEQRYDDPGPRLTFLFAATSKAISSFITYPFQIAKTRLQAGIPLDSNQPDETQPEATNGVDTESEKQAEDHRDIDGEVEDKLKTLRAVQNLAQKSIFGTVAQIIRAEGIGSLYDGVGAELLKGFFSHGTTMLAKDVVHKLLFKLYFVAIGVLTELRQRQRQPNTRHEMLPRALQYRIDRRPVGHKPNKNSLDYAVNVVANLIDGTQRPSFKEK
ncbi:mitochondrial carrier domain-containing protein [Xylariaceae sp. AK1471]|nr:mitochondrial carrier domain-containing protein [Xylariaceae sp. AK1471]